MGPEPKPIFGVLDRTGLAIPRNRERERGTGSLPAACSADVWPNSAEAPAASALLPAGAGPDGAAGAPGGGGRRRGKGR